MVEAAPFVFGWPELILTGFAVAVNFAVNGPRYLRSRREAKARAEG